MDFNVPLANTAHVAGGEGEGHPRRVPYPDSQNQRGNPRALAVLTACTSAWSHPAAQHHSSPLATGLCDAAVWSSHLAWIPGQGLSEFIRGQIRARAKLKLCCGT